MSLLARQEEPLFVASLGEEEEEEEEKEGLERTKSVREGEQEEDWNNGQS